MDLPVVVSGASAASIYEANGKRGDVGPAIRPLVQGSRLCAVAYTVRCVIGDARAIWFALARAPRGCVLVIDMGGTKDATSIGGTSVKVAIRRGLAGIVTNASVRDTVEIRASGLPVFAAGTSVRGTTKAHEGAHQVPVAIGSAVVAPGDLVFGDDDGLVIVPNADIANLETLLEHQLEREADIDRRVEAGEDILDILGFR